VDEQEHAGGAEPVPPPADGATAPLPAPDGAGQRRGRGAAARRAFTSRAAGWVVAAVLAGVIIGLLVSFARTSPTVAVTQAGPARFGIGPAGLPPGARVFGPAGVHRQIVIGPAGVQREVIIGPAGVQREVIIGPAGVHRQVIVCPPGLPAGAVVIGPAGLPARVIVIGPPGSGLPQRQVLPTGPVRVFLPGVPAKVSWRVVRLHAAVGAQLPASWAFPQLLPSSQVQASLHVAAPIQQQVTLPAGQAAVCASGQ
jgi:hypothetical protein